MDDATVADQVAGLVHTHPVAVVTVERRQVAERLQRIDIRPRAAPRLIEARHVRILAADCRQNVGQRRVASRNAQRQQVQTRLKVPRSDGARRNVDASHHVVVAVEQRVGGRNVVHEETQHVADLGALVDVRRACVVGVDVQQAVRAGFRHDVRPAHDAVRVAHADYRPDRDRQTVKRRGVAVRLHEERARRLGMDGRHHQLQALDRDVGPRERLRVRSAGRHVQTVASGRVAVSGEPSIGADGQRIDRGIGLVGDYEPTARRVVSAP